MLARCVFFFFNHFVEPWLTKICTVDIYHLVNLGVSILHPLGLPVLLPQFPSNLHYTLHLYGLSILESAYKWDNAVGIFVQIISWGIVTSSLIHVLLSGFSSSWKIIFSCVHVSYFLYPLMAHLCCFCVLVTVNNVLRTHETFEVLI